MTPWAVQLEGVSKRYPVGRIPNTYPMLRELLSNAACAWVRRRRPAPSEDARSLWALRNVTFEIGEGEAVGIIGRNGAGKSTLLRILARITRPSAGRVRLRGRVGSLLEVGAGFHAELTGRENIFLNAAILGMPRADIKRRLDSIIDFAGVAQIIDMPIKRYSSGMSVRLAFAVAAHVEPEILLIDEVLAVGDREFQKKCLGTLHGAIRQGRTVVFVSHDMAAVANLTQRTVLLERGECAQVGPTAAVVAAYVAGPP